VFFEPPETRVHKLNRAHTASQLPLIADDAATWNWTVSTLRAIKLRYRSRWTSLKQALGAEPTSGALRSSILRDLALVTRSRWLARRLGGCLFVTVRLF
jgi:hypothetical protein